MSSRPRITAIVTTFNEERNIAECIEALLWTDSVLVVDSYSTDRTVEIVGGVPEGPAAAAGVPRRRLAEELGDGPGRHRVGS